LFFFSRVADKKKLTRGGSGRGAVTALDGAKSRSGAGGRGLKKSRRIFEKKRHAGPLKKGVMGGNILRAFRPSGVHERVARARRTWGELSLAEQIAIAGLGGLGALTAARLLLGPRGDGTRELVDRYAKAKEHERGVIAGLCTSRVHDLRDLLLPDTELPA
jgi:hypothetical protein